MCAQRPAKTQISLGIHPVWSESSMSAWRKCGSLTTYKAHSEESDQTGQLPSLVWAFTGRLCHFVGFVMRLLKCYNPCYAVVLLKFLKWATTWQNQQNECAPSEDSDQPGHPPSLIRIFATRMKKAWSLATHWAHSEDYIRLGGCPGWSESSLGAQSLYWFCHVSAQITAAD